jgi:hypothetical protein
MRWLIEDRKQRLLRLHVEGGLDPDEAREFERMCMDDPRLAEEARVLGGQARLLGHAPQVEAPPDLSASIMDGVSRARPPGRIYAFLFTPRTVRVRIMTGLSAAAAAAAVVLLVVWGRVPAGREAGGGDAARQSPALAEATAPEPVDAQPSPGMLEFRIAAGAARSVTLIGDFNGWDEKGFDLSDDDGDGIWTLQIEASPGRYKYRFLVDGETWIPDPHADAQVDDGFGGTDSVRYVL